MPHCNVQLLAYENFKFHAFIAGSPGADTDPSSAQAASEPKGKCASA